MDLGTTYTSAAVFTSGWPSMVGLGNRAMQIPSVLFLKPDGTFLAGEAAERRGASEPDRLVREFKRRMGDDVPILVAGSPQSPQALQARLLRWVIDQVTQREGSTPDHVTLTHPANWGAYKRDLFQQTLVLADVTAADLCTEPEAAATLYAARNVMAVGDCVAVYDLGGGTFDAAVLRKTASGFDLLGRPEGIEHLGGIDFDEAVFHHVLHGLGDAVGAIPRDQHLELGLARLRRDCVEAKEALSSDTEAVVPVHLPGLSTSVRLVRAEFEAMIGPTIADTIGAMRRVLQSAELAPDDLQSIVLTGGSSRIPLVSQQITQAFERPLALDTHPKHDVAMGAAIHGVAMPGTPATTRTTKAGSTSGRSTQPVTPRPVEPGPPTGPPKEDRDPAAGLPLRLVLIGLGVLAVVAAAVIIGVWLSRGGEPSSTTPPTTPPGTTTGTSEPGGTLPSETMLVTGELPGGGSTIYRVDLQGSAPPHITTVVSGATSPHQPVITADRTRFLYLTTGNERTPGPPVVQRVGSDANAPAPMPPGCSAVYRPAFSPDGRLAAICDSGEGANLYAQDASGRFVEVPTTGEPTGDPTWAGPNEIIFLQRVGDGPRELYSIQSDGSRQRKLVDGSARRPDWCASGGLVFLQAANDEDEGGTVALLPPGRVTPRPINSFGRQVLSATWSPDCRELALVVGNAPPGQQIVIADATAPFTVTRRFGLPDGATASQPAWGSR